MSEGTFSENYADIHSCIFKNWEQILVWETFFLLIWLLRS